MSILAIGRQRRTDRSWLEILLSGVALTVVAAPVRLDPLFPPARLDGEIGRVAIPMVRATTPSSAPAAPPDLTPLSRTRAGKALSGRQTLARSAEWSGWTAKELTEARVCCPKWLLLNRRRRRPSNPQQQDNGHHIDKQGYRSAKDGHPAARRPWPPLGRELLPGWIRWRR